VLTLLLGACENSVSMAFSAGAARVGETPDLPPDNYDSPDQPPVTTSPTPPNPGRSEPPTTSNPGPGDDPDSPDQPPVTTSPTPPNPGRSEPPTTSNPSPGDDPDSPDQPPVTTSPTPPNPPNGTPSTVSPEDCRECIGVGGNSFGGSWRRVGSEAFDVFGSLANCSITASQPSPNGYNLNYCVQCQGRVYMMVYDPQFACE
jgi:hypothetical protein